MPSNRLLRVRQSLALFTLLSVTVGLVAVTSAQTGPRIVAATTVPSVTWQPHSAVDAAGNIYVTGLTAAPNANLVTVTKIDPALQTVLYSKVLGSGWSSPIVIDAAGHAVVGVDKTVFRLDPTGDVVDQMPIGSIVMDLAVGPSGRVYFAAASMCASPDPECSSEALAGWIDFANEDSYWTSIGGSDIDQPQSIAVRSDGHIVVAGWTRSADFPVTADAFISTPNDGDMQNGFVTVLKPNLNIAYSTYLRGDWIGHAHAVAAGQNGDFYVAFDADPSAMLPLGGGNVVVKFDKDANVVFMRRVRGAVYDSAEDAEGRLVLTGVTYGHLQSDVETRHVVGTPPTQDGAYVVALAADGASYDVVAYLGSGAVYGRSLALGSDGTAVVAGDIYTYYGATLAGETLLANPPAYQGYGEMNFISKVDLTLPAGNTAAGQDVTVTSGDSFSSVTFSSVTAPGMTTMTPVDPAALNLTLPGGFALSASSVAYEIQTTATVAGPITVCLDGSSLPPAEWDTAVILHGVGGQWVAEQTSHVGGGQLCTIVSSLSPFAVGVPVDTTAPTIAITSPASRVYLLNEVAAVTFTCTDAGIVTSCAASPSGAVLDTTSVGQRTVTVSARDAAGNTSTAAVTYTVSYGVTPESGREFKAGSTARLVVHLTDAAGANVSSAGILLRDVRVDGQPVDDTFAFSNGLNTYVLMLKTTGLTAGTHTLAFTAGSDPQPHSFSFVLW